MLRSLPVDQLMIRAISGILCHSALISEVSGKKHLLYERTLHKKQKCFYNVRGKIIFADWLFQLSNCDESYQEVR